MSDETPTEFKFIGHTIAHFHPLYGLTVQDQLMTKDVADQLRSALPLDDQLESVVIPIQITIPFSAVADWLAETLEMRADGFERLAEDILRYRDDDEQQESS